MKPWLTAAITILFAFTAVPAAAQEGKGGVQEGIRVHGNWVIEVRHPDGTLVERREFKSALTENGKAKLVRLVRGMHPIYAITVSFNQNFGPFDPVPGYTPAPLCQAGINLCRVFETTGPYASLHNDYFDFATMTATTEGSAIVLRGAITVRAPGGGRIERIATLMHESRTTNVIDGWPFLFTLATLPTPMVVPEGQIVQFTYTLNFF
jgi:hypothetical protein